MTQCPWCEKYVEWQLRRLSETGLTKDERHALEIEKKAIDAGFWATVKEIEHEKEIVNKLGIETALKLAGHFFINVETGETHVIGYGFYEMAMKRNQVYGKELEHCWVESGACGAPFLTAVCCELGIGMSPQDVVEWENRELGDVRGLSKRMTAKVKEEPL
jgi:hypothetical protein